MSQWRKRRRHLLLLRQPRSALPAEVSATGAVAHAVSAEALVASVMSAAQNLIPK